MPLEAPNLDLRTFEDLLREARARIPRYTPEWTDFNDSDPGMTLLQLFAWLSEILLFQMNQVPERNYVKFLELLGMQLTPAQPAEAHLTFTPVLGADNAAASARVTAVSAGTGISAQPEGGGEPLVFETAEGLDVIAQPLTDVQVWDGSDFTVVTLANRAVEASFRPFGWIPQAGSALYLGFAAPAGAAASKKEKEGVFPGQMRFRIFLPAAAGSGRQQATPAAGLAWEYRSPVAGHPWSPLTLVRDETAAFTREGYVLVAGPRETLPTVEGKIPGVRTWLRCRVEKGGYEIGREPEIDFIRPNVVPARNLTTVREELLGRSSGLPGQSFGLAHRPVAPGSLRLWLLGEDEEAFQLWTPVDDFLASGPGDSHYTLDANTGVAAFGDGARGRIPVAGAQIVAREYRYGGGAAGNVAAGAIKNPLGSLGNVTVANERPAVGGRDEQSLADLKERAPGALRTRGRAVTADDYASLAREVGGVAKAVCLPLAHPDFPEVEVPGAVTVIVVPNSLERPPQPGADLLDAVSRHLDRHRLLTTELYVRGPRFVPVKVEAVAVADPAASFEAVALAVRRTLDEYLDPLAGELGKDLFLSRFYEVILRVPEVREVAEITVTVGRDVHSSRDSSLGQPVAVPKDGLVYGVDHRIDVVSYQDR